MGKGWETDLRFIIGEHNHVGPVGRRCRDLPVHLLLHAHLPKFASSLFRSINLSRLLQTTVVVIKNDKLSSSPKPDPDSRRTASSIFLFRRRLLAYSPASTSLRQFLQPSVLKPNRRKKPAHSPLFHSSFNRPHNSRTKIHETRFHRQRLPSPNLT